MNSYVGVDWASRGWLAVVVDGDEWTTRMYPSIQSVWFEHREAESILVDIPIGLPESSRRGCDRGAKEFLRPERARSVFWTPCRDAVYQDTYDDAKEKNIDARGDSLSSQAWGLIPRIQEVDRFLRGNEAARETIIESHPEVCFKSFAGESLSSKHGDEGIENRQTILEQVGENVEGVYEDFVEEYIENQPSWARRIGNSNRDDLLDAMVLALAAKVGNDEFERILDHPQTEVESIPEDEQGLPMQIVYADPR